MGFLLQSPANWLLAALFADAAAFAGWRGVRGGIRSLKKTRAPGHALAVVYAIRWVIFAIAAAILAAGFFFTSKVLLILGGIFLLEEIYETGFVLLALRSERGGGR